MTFKLITIYLMSLLYISSGVQHFANTGWFMKIMPPYLSYHKELIYISGIIEIILGTMLLFEKTRFLASFFWLQCFDCLPHKISTWCRHSIRKIISASRRIVWNSFQTCLKKYTISGFVFLASVFRVSTPKNKHLVSSFKRK